MTTLKPKFPEPYDSVVTVVRALKAEGFDVGERREIIELLPDDDITIGNYRFVAESAIDDILANELESDPYVLGCFNAYFITSHSTLDCEIVEALQAGDKYEALGNHLINNDCVKAMAQDYASADGYGHHFSQYDGSEVELELDSKDYYMFRIG